MLSVYLFALIVGGVLLAVSFFGSHHGADSNGHDAQLDSSGPSELHGSDSHEAAHQHNDHISGQSLLAGLVSMRVWTYLLAFGGITGLLLRLVAKLGEPAAALTALGVGLASGYSARALFARAARMGGGGTIRDRDMIGQLATVLIPFGKAETGKVRLQLKGSTVDLLAFSEEARALQQQDQVLILDFRDGRALVSRSDEREE